MLKRILRDAALQLTLALLLFGLLEGGTRGILRLRDGHWPESRAGRFDREIRDACRLYRPHPFLNTAPSEGARIELFGKRASFNRAGYRSPERELAKKPGTRRILCAGGSTTFDLLAPDDSSTWPARLEGLLSQHGPVEVWNGGFPGWTSLESLIALELRDIDLEPDLVILFQAINDLQPGAHQPFDAGYEHGHAEVARRALGFELAAPALWRRSLLVEKLGGLLGRTEEDPWRALAWDTGTPRRSALEPAAARVFERNLRSYLAVARAHGARVLWVTQMMRLRQDHRQEDLAYTARWLPWLDPESAPRELEALNQVPRSLAAAGLGDLADAARDLSWEDRDFADPFHFSPEGSQKLADYLAGKVLALGALGPGNR
ncbi:MAG TPA: SGNH/GDSL hydrolase family protein [Thermoanaerobaculia bacterium]|nr:SGNH/GDSL hydrolase family protein [Thermoanaerobaculia bacterium]